jgi:hypothetical protein
MKMTLTAQTICAAARFFEGRSAFFGTRSPLTGDFVRIGMASCHGDTTRMRRELPPEPIHPIFRKGIDTL